MAEEAYQLVVNKGPLKGEVFHLGQDNIIIGRDQYADIVFDHVEVSRHHARMTRVAEGYVLQDLGSTNGTFVDGKQLGGDPVLLKPGQTIYLGGAVSLNLERAALSDPVATVVAPIVVQETVVSQPETPPDIEDTVALQLTQALANPYMGPRAFEAGERQFFYGRDDEIAILAGQVMSRRASLFFAQSGAGKSSLLRAGLLPELTRRDKVGRGPRARFVQKMRVMPILDVGYSLPEELIDIILNVYVFGALSSLYPDKTAGELAGLTLCEGLAPYFGQADDGAAGDDEVPDTLVSPSAGLEEPDAGATKSDLSTLLIFDQFEELFTYHPEHWRKREDFFRQVGEALEEYPDLHVLFTMREDFIAELTPYANLLPEQLRARFRLERLKRNAALKAIVAPAEMAGRSFAEGVAEALVDNLRRGQPKQESLAGEPTVEAELGAYVEPVHLQIVCRQLWENLPSKRTIIEAVDVQAFGDVDQALTGFYESTLAEVTARTDISPRRLRAWFDEQVITPARTRGLVYRGEEETEGLPNAAVDILNDAYIIRADIRGGDVWYTLAHDRLVEPVLGANITWRVNYENPLDKATRAWLAAGRDPGQLLDGAQLTIAQTYADENPNDVLSEEHEFLVESRRQEQLAAEQAEREAKRRRRTIIAASAVAIVLLIATIVAVGQAIRATEEEEKAKVSERLAQTNEALAEEKALEAEAARDDAEFQAERAAESALEAEASAELAETRAEEARQAQAEAELQRDEAERQKETAERQRRLSLAEGLAANALAVMSGDINDPSLALILARRAVNVTRDVDGFVQDNARRALLESVANAPPWLMNLPRYTHEDAVTRGGFSPDGERLVSGSWDGTAKVWDIASGATLLTLAGHRGSVNSAAYSPDGATIVTGSDDGTVRIWDATSGEKLRDLDGHDDWVEQASFDPGGERVVSAGSDGVAKVWDVASGEEVLVLEGHGDRVFAANFDSQGERIVTAGGDGTARVWDAGNGQQLVVLEGHEGIVAWAVFNAAGDRIATASLDGTARVWDAERGDVVAFIEGSGAEIVSALFSGDGEQLVTASRDGSGAVWNARSGALIHELLGHLGQVKFADFSPDDQLIMTTGEDRSIRLWDAATAEAVRSLGGGGGAAVDAAFSGDSSRLVVGSDDGMVAVWDVATGDELAKFRAHESGLTGLEIDTAGQRIVTSSEDGTARVWDAEAGVEQLALEGHDGSVSDVAFKPDGSVIATVGQDGQLLVWNAASGELELFRTDAGVSGINDVVFSADGSTLATHSESDGQIKIWDATTLEPQLTISEQWGTTSIDLSPDGREVVASNTNGTVSVLDAFGGQVLLFLEAHPNFVRSAAFSPDGSLIVTASDDTTARVWDAETGDERDVLTGHGDWLTSATFSPNGRLVASTDQDGVTKLWALTAPALIPELAHDGGPIFQAAYTPDGQRLITNGNDFKVNVWDAESGEALSSRIGLILDRSPFESTSNLAILPVVQDETGAVILWNVIDDEIISTLAGHAGWVDGADISGDGQIALTAGCDELDEASGTCVQGTAKIWDAASGEELLSLPHEPVGFQRLSNQYILDGALELSRDGSRLVTGACIQLDEDGICTNSQVTVWDTMSGQQVMSFETGLGSIWRIEFSPDRSSLYTTGGEGTQVWNSATGERIRSIPGEFGAVDLRGERLVTVGDEFAATIYNIRTGTALATLSGHRDGINAVEFSPNDEYLITSSWDGTARVWNTSTGVEILSLAEHEGQIWDAHFSPDGRSIVTTSEDGTALIWPFAVDKLLELSEPSIQRYSPFLTPEELARFGLTGD